MLMTSVNANWKRIEKARKSEISLIIYSKTSLKMTILFSNLLHTSLEVLEGVFLSRNDKKKHELNRESCSDKTTRIKHAAKCT